MFSKILPNMVRRSSSRTAIYLPPNTRIVVGLARAMSSTVPSETSDHAGDSKCWKCHRHFGPNLAKHKKTLFCPSPDCRVIQPLPSDPAETAAFELFELDPSFDIDQKELDDNFKELQKLLHPDKFSTRSKVEQDIATDSSSIINHAYQVQTETIIFGYCVTTVHQCTYFEV